MCNISFQKRMLTITNDWTKQHVTTFSSFFSVAAWKKKRHCLKNIICFQRYYGLNPLHDSLSALLDVSTSRRLLHDLQSYARQSNFNSILLILSANDTARNDTARNNLSRILNRKFSILTQVSWNGVMYLDLQSLNKYRY